MNRIASFSVAAVLSSFAALAFSNDLTTPIASPDLIFDEVDGTVSVEAEHFYKQTRCEKRAWYIASQDSLPQSTPDPDSSHVKGASGGAYLEILPDTRDNHSQKLEKGQNFTDVPGQMAVVHYRVNVNTPGRYYVWVRSYSTGAEDNGVHVGIDGAWPESGRRWQTVQKNSWTWDCRQRTQEVHVGVAMQLYLDIETVGQHEIAFSMREDGFEMDKFILSRDESYIPVDMGPASSLKSGILPVSRQEIAETPIVSEGSPTQRAKAKRQTGRGDKSDRVGLVLPRQPDGNGKITITGELKQWHKVTLSLDGPYAHERDSLPNPFSDLALNVRFTHESGAPSFLVPGYFAADGNAIESAAECGTTWRAHFSPEKIGRWDYKVSLEKGREVAIGGSGEAVKPFHALSGSFTIDEADKNGRDFRAHGRLQYVGKHHLQFAGSNEYFLKVGVDSPETLLAYVDFDNTIAGKPAKSPLKTWQPHQADWKPGDPHWHGEKGKGLVGALNYLANKGLNAFSFLTYNAAGDGDNVWPFVDRDAKLNYDCSKLDQWGVVFDHATKLGLHLHFKLQENEMDDNRLGVARKERIVPESLDGGKLGPERKLYCREMIARFGHALALNWNIGEENTQSGDEVRDMVQYIHDTDPYKHNIVIHTFPPEQESVYRPLIGDKSLLTGVSLQNPWHKVHQRTLQWLRESAIAGRPWIVANDEQNPAGLGVPPDPGYRGHSGIAVEKQINGDSAEGNVTSRPYTLHDIRKLTLWGNLMAGGAGVEYYFGYSLPENDLVAEDFRSRDQSWDYCRIAVNFFKDNGIPFSEMTNANRLIGNSEDDNSKYCLAKPSNLYLVYLPSCGSSTLDLSDESGVFSVHWFNPRSGGELATGSISEVKGGSLVSLGDPPSDATEDWLAVVRR